MSVYNYDYTVYRKAEQPCWLVCSFLHTIHKSPLEEYLRKRLQSICSFVNTDTKYERYRRFVEKYNEKETAKKLTSSNMVLVNAVMHIFENVFGDPETNLFDKIGNNGMHTTEDFDTYIKQGKDMIKKIAENGEYPIYYIEKNYLFMVPRQYKDTETFENFLKNVYTYEKLQEASGMATLMVF